MIRRDNNEIISELNGHNAQIILIKKIKKIQVQENVQYLWEQMKKKNGNLKKI